MASLLGGALNRDPIVGLDGARKPPKHICKFIKIGLSAISICLQFVYPIWHTESTSRFSFNDHLKF